MVHVLHIALMRFQTEDIDQAYFDVSELMTEYGNQMLHGPERAVHSSKNQLDGLAGIPVAA